MTAIHDCHIYTVHNKYKIYSFKLHYIEVYMCPRRISNLILKSNMFFTSYQMSFYYYYSSREAQPALTHLCNGLESISANIVLLICFNWWSFARIATVMFIKSPATQWVVACSSLVNHHLSCSGFYPLWAIDSKRSAHFSTRCVAPEQSTYL